MAGSIALHHPFFRLRDASLIHSGKRFILVLSCEDGRYMAQTSEDGGRSGIHVIILECFAPPCHQNGFFVCICQLAIPGHEIPKQSKLSFITVDPTLTTRWKHSKLGYSSKIRRQPLCLLGGYVGTEEYYSTLLQ